jgi:hypothetical protein
MTTAPSTLGPTAFSYGKQITEMEKGGCSARFGDTRAGLLMMECASS